MFVGFLWFDARVPVGSVNPCCIFRYGVIEMSRWRADRLGKQALFVRCGNTRFIVVPFSPVGESGEILRGNNTYGSGLDQIKVEAS